MSYKLNTKVRSLCCAEALDIHIHHFSGAQTPEGEVTMGTTTREFPSMRELFDANRIRNVRDELTLKGMTDFVKTASVATALATAVSNEITAKTITLALYVYNGALLQEIIKELKYHKDEPPELVFNAVGKSILTLLLHHHNSARIVICGGSEIAKSSDDAAMARISETISHDCNCIGETLETLGRIIPELADVAVRNDK